MLDVLDASAIRAWCAAASAAMTAGQQEIDDLNVFPVPDGDTGTNLTLTLRSAADAIGAVGSDGAGEVLQVMARGAVLGARGNSGVILAQILRGMADAAGDSDTIDAAMLKKALSQGAEMAYSAVAEPMEGTMLSVVRQTARAAEDAHSTVADVLSAAFAAATEALARTTDQLEPLRRAGVVDAGGCGLLVVLGALRSVVTGVPVAGGPLVDRQMVGAGRWAGTGVSPAFVAARESGSERYDYEVQYLLQADEAAVAGLKERLAGLGDSLVVAGAGGSEWNVHVHVADVGAAIEAGIQAGRPYRVSVVRFADHADHADGADHADHADRASSAGSASGPARAGRAGVAIVAVAPGAGVADVFRGEGVHVVDGGPGGGPSTADVLEVIHATGAASVVLLPNAAQVDGVAALAAAQARTDGIAVAVVPTRSPVQGLAAVAVHDAERRFEDDVITMAETAAATRWAEITVAPREALTMAGRCQPGDVLGLISGEVVVIGVDIDTVAQDVIDRLLGVGGELVTVLLGAQAPPTTRQVLTSHLAAEAPHAEIAFYPGGQPDFPLLIGVE